MRVTVKSAMRLVQFKHKNEQISTGLLVGNNDKVVKYSDCSLVEVLNREDQLEKLRKFSTERHQQQHYNLNEIKLLSPITNPDKIIGLAANFKDDCDKRKVAYPTEPVLFTKFPSTITGPHNDITKPINTNAVDWEVELAVIVGKMARNVKKENAFDYVFGYTATQDLTAKDCVKSMGQLTVCKNFDMFSPLGPCVVTKDEIVDPYNLKLKTWVNGELKQNGNTKEMLFKIEDIIEYLTRTMTLMPGDVILTGTPFGVGSSQNPQQFLQVGDVLETEVEHVGKMKHKFV